MPGLNVAATRQWAGSICAVPAARVAGFRNGPAVTGSAKVIVASLSFNFFFLAPVGTLRIADPQNLAELFTLLTVSLLASHLSSQVREAQVLRRAAELKSALLESLSHALKTPLTAVTIAANNLNAAALTAEERQEQAGIVRAELDRLNRMFQDIVDMARIETRSVAAEKEWVQPAEIVEAAARQVESSCDEHPLDVELNGDRSLVRVDPRLTSAALAHVLENAGQYSPAGTPIDINVLEISSKDVCEDPPRNSRRRTRLKVYDMRPDAWRSVWR